MALPASSKNDGLSFAVTTRVNQTTGSPADGQAALMEQVMHVREMTRVPDQKAARRLFWFWLRVYVRERGNKRVNVRIPIPIPLLGVLLPRELDFRRALTLQEQMTRSRDPRQTLNDFLDSNMAFECVRVESEDELVVVGFD